MQPLCQQLQGRITLHREELKVSAAVVEVVDHLHVNVVQQIAAVPISLLALLVPEHFQHSSLNSTVKLLNLEH